MAKDNNNKNGHVFGSDDESWKDNSGDNNNDGDLPPDGANDFMDEIPALNPAFLITQISLLTAQCQNLEKLFLLQKEFFTVLGEVRERIVIINYLLIAFVFLLLGGLIGWWLGS